MLRLSDKRYYEQADEAASARLLLDDLLGKAFWRGNVWLFVSQKGYTAVVVSASQETEPFASRKRSVWGSVISLFGKTHRRVTFNWLPNRPIFQPFFWPHLAQE